MRILVYGEFYTESFAQHISENLDLMGHEVIEYPHQESFAQNNAFKNNKLVKVFKRLKGELSSSVKSFRATKSNNFFTPVSFARKVYKVIFFKESSTRSLECRCF